MKQVEVTPEDRELFILLLGRDAFDDTDKIRAGAFDHWLKMQAIARHRTASLSTPASDKAQGDNQGERDETPFAISKRKHEEKMAALSTPDKAQGDVELLDRAIDRMGWDEIHAFQAVLYGGQDIYEDAGGFMLRAIKALFGVKKDPVMTYRAAARAFVERALSTPQSDKTA